MGACWQRNFSATSGRGAGDPQTCPNFRLWLMVIPIQNATTRRVRSRKRCLKTHNSEDECTFLSNIFIPTPKITPKPHFRGPFDAKLIMQRALRQSNVNGATTLKLYGYRGIGKYLGCVRIFPLAGIWGVQGPLMLIWDPPIISETIGARK